MIRRPIKLSSRKAGTACLIKVSGRLDPGDGPDQLSEMVQEFIEKDETDFLLDLRSVTYVSSTGVGSLIKTYRAVLKKKGKDRKSTRLNSSHVSISYAVFCLKKKKKK